MMLTLSYWHSDSYLISQSYVKRFGPMTESCLRQQCRCAIVLVLSALPGALQPG